MRIWCRILVWLGVLSLILAAYAWAQPAAPGTGSSAMRQRGGMGMGYDPQNLETVRGVVTKVTASKRRAKGVHLQVKTDKEDLFIILGPAYFLEKQKMTLAEGEKVEITGSRIKHPQAAILIAGELKKGSQVVKFRDEKGLPLWRRSPRRQ